MQVAKWWFLPIPLLFPFRAVLSIADIWGFFPGSYNFWYLRKAHFHAMESIWQALHHFYQIMPYKKTKSDLLLFCSIWSRQSLTLQSVFFAPGFLLFTTQILLCLARKPWLQMRIGEDECPSFKNTKIKFAWASMEIYPSIWRPIEAIAIHRDFSKQPYLCGLGVGQYGVKSVPLISFKFHYFTKASLLLDPALKMCYWVFLPEKKAAATRKLNIM